MNSVEDILSIFIGLFIAFGIGYIWASIDDDEIEGR